MLLRTLDPSVSLAGKRVLLRIDGNVPVHNGKVMEGRQGKLARAAVDIEWLRQKGAKCILLTHFGRPNGRRVMAYSVRPIGRRLSELLGTKVVRVPEVVGKRFVAAVSRMNNGDVVLLENVRFDAREEKNDKSLAEAWGAQADLFINDAFSVSHRAHASVDAITSVLPSYAGPSLQQEVEILSKTLKQPKQPFFLAMGGLKMDTKLPVIERFLGEASAIAIGGALATVFLKAQGYEVGKSVYDKGSLKIAKSLLKKAGSLFLLPTDVVVASSFRKNARYRTVAIDKIRSKDAVVDVGPETLERIAQAMTSAKTILWNGPFGYSELPLFAKGTKALAELIASRTDSALTIVGGGDTVPLMEAWHLERRFTFVSTGGGAMLEFLSGKALPGVVALEK